MSKTVTTRLSAEDQAIALFWATATSDDDAIASWNAAPYKAAEANLYVVLAGWLIEHDTPMVDVPVLAQAMRYVLSETGPEPVDALLQGALQRVSLPSFEDTFEYDTYRYESEPWSQQ